MAPIAVDEPFACAKHIPWDVLRNLDQQGLAARLRVLVRKRLSKCRDVIRRKTEGQVRKKKLPPVGNPIA